MKISDQIIKGLKDFAQALKTGNLDCFRITKVVKMDDGTYKRVVRLPKRAK